MSEAASKGLRRALFQGGVDLDRPFFLRSDSTRRAFPSTELAYLRYYRDGVALGEATRGGDRLNEAVGAASAWAESASDRAPTSAVVVLVKAAVALNEKNCGRVFSDIHRGVLGIVFSHGGSLHAVSPTECLATNLPLKVLLERRLNALELNLDTLLLEGAVWSFTGQQIFVDLPGQRATLLHRGSQPLSMDDLSLERLRSFEETLSLWMLNNVLPDGRMTYSWLAAQDGELDDNNMVRQWMATVCLGRIGARHRHLGDSDVGAVVERNLDYNLKSFYRQEGRLGVIDREGRVSLGATALALMGVFESARRAEFREVEAGLLQTTFELQNQDGSFRTWLRPAERSDNQQFFPGEALLSWALLAQVTEELTLRRTLVARIQAAYRFYRGWHLRNRHPAFVPWHTQAYCSWLTLEDSEEVADWIFEMNDWLLGMQSHSRLGYDDTLGRFYDPTRPFGPPHSSATGVYLEGLSDAFALCRKRGDQRRARAYRRAIVLGLRSAMQLQFRDDPSLYYVPSKERVRGGMKTTVYDSEIRVDNVQHVLMAVQKLTGQLTQQDFSSR